MFISIQLLEWFLNYSFPVIKHRHAEKGGQVGSLPGSPGTQGPRPARICQFFHDFIECTSICDDSR